jgi:hypothetical protein
MDDAVEKVTELLRLAGETHHAVYRITDGADDDWATWYSDWLVNLSELPEILGKEPVRSELTHLLVRLGKEYDTEAGGQSWQRYYAQEIVRHFFPDEE